MSRELFERVSRPLLARLLAPYEAYFALRGVSLGALAESHQDDRAGVHAVYDAVHDKDPRTPAALLRDLAAIAGIASPAVCEEAIRLDVEQRLPRAHLIPEDVAFLLRLDHPELFEKVRPFARSAAARGYSECVPKEHRPFPTSREALDRVEQSMAIELEGRRRRRLCRIHCTETPDEVLMDVVYGKLPAAHDKVTGEDESSLRLEQETRVHTERARAIVCKKTGRLSLGGYPFIKDMLRRHLGEALFGEVAFYQSGKSLLTLAPLKENLDAALAHEDIPDLDGVTLRAISIARTGGGGPTFVGPSGGDVRDAVDGDLLRAALAREGTVTHATFAFVVRGVESPVKLEARARDAHLDFERSDARVEAVLRDFLALRGYVDMPLRAMAEVG